MDPDDVELRVLGCLIEKQRATPDHYPLTLNALRLACNQSTNRDPVVDYDETTVRDAAQRLGRRRWTRLASGQGSRAPKYRHLLDEALGVGDDEISLLAVLLLRGPQTPGELKARADRLHHFADLGEVQHAIEKLISRGHAERLPRRPGQKEERYAQTLGGGAAGPQAADAPEAHDEGLDPADFVTGPPRAAEARPRPDGRPGDADADATAALRDEVAELRAEVARLRDEVAALRGPREP